MTSNANSEHLLDALHSRIKDLAAKNQRIAELEQQLEAERAKVAIAVAEFAYIRRHARDYSGWWSSNVADKALTALQAEVKP